MPQKPCRCESVLQKFSHTTSFHGVAHIAAARNPRGRMFWTMVVFACLSVFIYQLVPTVQRYFRYDKIMEIRIDVYMDAVHQTDDPRQQRRRRSTQSRLKRYVLVALRCTCIDPSDSSCKPEPASNETDVVDIIELTTNKTTVCTCVRRGETATPTLCALTERWEDTKCKSCDPVGVCAEDSLDLEITRMYRCTCRRPAKNMPATTGKPFFNNEEEYCVAHKDEVIEENLLELGPTIDTPQPPVETREEKIERVYGKNKGKTAMQTTAVQNLIGEASNVPENIRVNMSYSKEETIRSCSYGGSDCNVTRDFRLITDPGFGNCFTFNEDARFKAARPGSLFGLRVLLFTNKEEYLPTTESMGVKISIHHQSEYPFPDTFGYNAPVGFLSSFAVQAQKIVSLPHPYGDCINLNTYNFTSEQYLYGEKYSIEGCQRSCLQRENINHCYCADPKMPYLNNTPTCDVSEKARSECLDDVAQRLLDNPTICECGQPCTKTNYHVSFSSAVWPSESSRVRQKVALW